MCACAFVCRHVAMESTDVNVRQFVRTRACRPAAVQRGTECASAVYDTHIEDDHGSIFSW